MAKSENVHFRRVVLKLSGESFAHSGERGISMDSVVHVASQIHSASAAMAAKTASTICQV